MAAYDLQEQEQIANIKAFWKSWGTPILVALLAAVAVIVGSKLWHGYQLKQAEAASDRYFQLEESVRTGKPEDAVKLVAGLRNDFHATPYATRGSLLIAQQAMARKDYKLAREQLQWVISNAKEPDLADLARLRMAAILLDEKRYPEALKAIEAKPDDAYMALYAEMRGDILLAQGKLPEAAKAFEIAINKVEKQSIQYSLLQMKMDSLGYGK